MAECNMFATLSGAVKAVIVEIVKIVIVKIVKFDFSNAGVRLLNKIEIIINIIISILLRIITSLLRDEFDNLDNDNLDNIGFRGESDQKPITRWMSAK